jgi:uncharacterized protein YhfF
VSERPSISFAFGCTPEVANDRAEKVITGKKTATSSPYASGSVNDSDYPEVGRHDIVLDGSDRPAAVIETTSLRIKKFVEIDEAHALAEGYSSLAEWMSFKEDMFRREGIFDAELLLLCQHFRLVKVLKR